MKMRSGPIRDDLRPAPIHPRGFALPIILLLLATITVVATRHLQIGLDGRDRVAAEIIRTQERLALESAAELILGSIKNRDASTLENLSTPERSLRLEIGDIETETTLVSESGKVDLNAAPLGLIAATIEVVLGRDRADRVIEDARRRRSEGRPYLSEIDILPRDERYGPPANVISEAFTIATGSQGVVVEDAPAAVRRALEILAGQGHGTGSPMQIGMNGIAPFVAADRAIFSLRTVCVRSRRSLFLTFRTIPETGSVIEVRRRF